MLKGIAASKGYSIGTVLLQKHEEIVISDEKITDIEAEKAKLDAALEAQKLN